jgi:membrane complex biogenesis BtpA family protein
MLMVFCSIISIWNPPSASRYHAERSYTIFAVTNGIHISTTSMISNNDPRPLLPGILRPIIGMVHLKPLPGTPRYGGSWQEVLDAALTDAEALHAGGIDAIMVENYGDVPFHRGSVEPHTIAALALVAEEIRRMTGRPLGINVLRNDAMAAMGIAAICSAVMIRVNVHTGAVLADQGVIQGSARETLDYRTKLRADVRILADVNVKHAMPLAPFPIEEAAADAVERGLADALIVTGSRTGASADIDELRRARAAVDAPVLVGSGVTDATAAELLRVADGAIVGSWLKHGGDVEKPVDRERVERLMGWWRGSGHKTMSDKYH